jgi:hypothetical protein
MTRCAPDRLPEICEVGNCGNDSVQEDEGVHVCEIHIGRCICGAELISTPEEVICPVCDRAAMVESERVAA